MVWNGLILFAFIILMAGGLFFVTKLLIRISASMAAEENADAAAPLASFSFTEEEWRLVYQTEFVEDERGKGLFDKYSGIISYERGSAGIGRPEIIFTRRLIYLTDGRNGKSFTVNRLNAFGNGFRLFSVDLLHLTPLKKLRIKVSGVGIDPESNDLDFEREYLVPLPQSSNEKIGEVLKIYGDLILNG